MCMCENAYLTIYINHLLRDLLVVIVPSLGHDALENSYFSVFSGIPC